MGHETRSLFVVQVSEDQQRSVRARLLRGAEVLVRREEALRRAAARRSRRARRGGRPTSRRSGRRRGRRSLPRRRARRRARCAPGRASGRRSPADGERRLISAIAPSPGRRSASSKRPIRTDSCENAASSSSRAAAVPASSVARAISSPSRKSCACPAAAMPPAAFRSTASRFGPCSSPARIRADLDRVLLRACRR